MRRDRAAARRFADRHAIPFATDQAAEVVRHPEVDVVYVATPPAAHLPHVLAAAEARKPVVCEKPLATSTAEAWRMICACEEAGVELFAAYTYRFWPSVRKMAELIGEGRIGAPLQASLEMARKVAARGEGGFWRETPEISGGGLFVDVGAHRLDVLVFLLGGVRKAHGVTGFPVAAIRTEQTLALCAEFESGATLAALADYISGRQADRLRIIGTEGELEMNHLHTASFVLCTPAGEERFAFEAPAAPHVGLVRHVEAVLAGKASNASSGRDALHTERLLDAACRDAVRRRMRRRGGALEENLVPEKGEQPRQREGGRTGKAG
jgi:predicted dehydrogenase